MKIVRPRIKVEGGGASGGSPTPSVSVSPAPVPEPRNRPLVPPRAPSSAKARNKVLLSVLDGRIEWEKMTSESRKAFEGLFKDKEFLSQFGLTGKEKAFAPEQMKALYDAASLMYQTVCGMFLRWPPQILKMLAYTEDQKEMLAGPTADLANRFAPAFLVKHSELLIWGGMFAAVTQKNFLQAAGELKKLQARPAAPAVVQLPRPMTPAAPAPPAAAGVAPAERPAPAVNVPFAMPSSLEDDFPAGGADPVSLG